MLYMIENKATGSKKIVDINIYEYQRVFDLGDLEHTCVMLSIQFGGKPVNHGNFTAYKYQ